MITKDGTYSDLTEKMSDKICATLRNCNNLIGMVKLEIRFGMCNELKIDDEKKGVGGDF